MRPVLVSGALALFIATTSGAHAQSCNPPKSDILGISLGMAKSDALSRVVAFVGSKPPLRRIGNACGPEALRCDDNVCRTCIEGQNLIVVFEKFSDDQRVRGVKLLFETQQESWSRFSVQAIRFLK
jgi:hypothetical protein